MKTGERVVTIVRRDAMDVMMPRDERPSSHAARRVGDELPACETVLDIIGDLFTHGRQLKHLVFDDRIVSLLGKLPILGCFVPEIVSPVHGIQSNEPGW